MQDALHGAVIAAGHRSGFVAWGSVRLLPGQSVWIAARRYGAHGAEEALLPRGGRSSCDRWLLGRGRPSWQRPWSDAEGVDGEALSRKASDELGCRSPHERYGAQISPWRTSGTKGTAAFFVP